MPALEPEQPLNSSPSIAAHANSAQIYSSDTASTTLVLKQFPLHLHDTARAIPITAGGFSGARVWKIETAGPPLCLRQWPAGGLPRERIQGLHRLCAHLAARELHVVPVPFTALHGATLVEAGQRFWQLEPWMPGTADFQLHPALPRLDAALRCLADWHQAAASFVPRGAECRWFHSLAEAPVPAIADRIEFIDYWTPVRCAQAQAALAQLAWVEFRDSGLEILQLFGRAAGRIRDELAAVSRLTLRVQPCLRDVWHDHVLYSGDVVTGLIDPGACRTDTVATDVARLLGSLTNDRQDLWDFALDRYCRYHPLTPAEQRLVGLLDRSTVLLSGMTWLRWVLFEHRRWPQPERVIERLRQILGRLQRLVNGPAPGPFYHP